MTISDWIPFECALLYSRSEWSPLFPSTIPGFIFWPVVILISLGRGVAAAPLSPSISKRWQIPNLSSDLSLDPVSLITLFFDSPEKELICRSPDLRLLSCFGLFANPTTAWGEYGTLRPGEGIRYYNPQRELTSTIEIAHVNDYLTRLSAGRKDVGITVTLQLPRTKSLRPSVNWAIVRPTILLAVLFIAAASLDYIALGALGALLFGQSIVIVKSVADGTPKAASGSTEEKNVFFLSNNVTVIVKSYGNLFVDACSTLKYNKEERPVLIEICATVIFMAGVLLVGIAGLNFKIAYLVGHVIQAILLALSSNRPLGTQIRNCVLWEVEKESVVLNRRRDAYLWATLETTGHTKWLVSHGLATEEVIQYVEQGLAAKHPKVRSLILHSNV